MIAVVGGGITGLAVGWELTRRGADVVVLEAEVAPGGVISSDVIDGRVIDRGPQRTRRAGGVARMLDALDLGRRVIAAPADLPLLVYREGKLRSVPFSVPDFASSDVVSLRAKLRLLLEPITGPADPRESVAEFFTRKLGREVYEALVAPLYGGLYGSDPADMEVGLSLVHLLKELRVGRSLVWRLLRRGGRLRPPPPCSFLSGMQELPMALAASLGSRLRLGSPVRSFRPVGRRWSIECADQQLDVSAVVVCTSAQAAAELFAEVAPRSANALRRLTYNPLAVVHLDAETELRGLGFQVAFTERPRLLRGVTFNHSLFGRRNLYTAFLGGALRPEVARMDEGTLARAATDEFASCTGREASVLAVSRAWMPAWDRSWAALRGFALPDGLYVAGSWRSRPGLAGRLNEAEKLARELVPDTPRQVRQGRRLRPASRRISA